MHIFLKLLRLISTFKLRAYIVKPLFLPLLLPIAGCTNNYYASPYWELPDTRLEYIAITRTGRNESVTVIYNPVLCERIGEACGFFRSHAFAHDFLNHQIFNDPKFYTESIVSAADCWAAKNGKPNETTAAVYFLLDKSQHEGIKINGDPQARADLIKRCAIENDRWLGDKNT